MENCKAYIVGPTALVLSLLASLTYSGESPKLSAAELKNVYKTVGLKESGREFLDACDQLFNRK